MRRDTGQHQGEPGSGPEGTGRPSPAGGPAGRGAGAAARGTPALPAGLRSLLPRPSDGLRCGGRAHPAASRRAAGERPAAPAGGLRIPGRRGRLPHLRGPAVRLSHAGPAATLDRAGRAGPNGGVPRHLSAQRGRTGTGGSARGGLLDHRAHRGTSGPAAAAPRTQCARAHPAARSVSQDLAHRLGHGLGLQEQ